MFTSDICLAEVYCQDAYSAANHDLIAEAFCRAYATFNPNKGDFRTWVGIQRSGVVREEQRLRRRVEYVASYDREVSANLEDAYTGHPDEEELGGATSGGLEREGDALLLSGEAIFNATFRKEQKKIVNNLLTSVNNRSRTIIRKRFYQEKKMGQVAQELGITDSTVDRDEKKTLRLFREKLENNNLFFVDLVA